LLQKVSLSTDRRIWLQENHGFVITDHEYFSLAVCHIFGLCPYSALWLWYWWIL